MISIQHVSGNTFDKLPYEDLISKLDDLGFNKHRLRDSAGGYPIYAYSLGDIGNNPVIYIDGHLHNSHEWRSSYWIMQFMELIVNPIEQSPANYQLINKMKSKYAFYFLPCGNPDAYSGDFGVGVNANKVNITHNFDYNWEETPFGTPERNKGEYPFSEPESQNVRDIILDLKPVTYINCHAWGGFTGFTLRHPVNKKYDLLTQNIFKNIKFTTKLRVGTQARVSDELEISSSYNWAGQFLSRQGRPIIANVFESGTEESLEWQSILGVNGLLLNCVYVDNYLTNNSLTIN